MLYADHDEYVCSIQFLESLQKHIKYSIIQLNFSSQKIVHIKTKTENIKLFYSFQQSTFLWGALGETDTCATRNISQQIIQHFACTASDDEVGSSG